MWTNRWIDDDKCVQKNSDEIEKPKKKKKNEKKKKERKEK